MNQPNEHRPNVLLTNVHLNNYSGSEIDTVTCANWFYKNGYDVDIFTLKASGPILNCLEDGIRIFPLAMAHTLAKEYDLIWAHHAALLDYVLLGNQIKAKKVVYHMLGALPDLERPPHYAKSLSALFSISNETRDVFAALTDIARDNIHILPNYAEERFFQYLPKNKDTYQKICIVSNHVAEELFEFKVIAEQNGLTVDIYGLQGTVTFVDDVLLSGYDAIISIGKTVWWGMAMGIPVYCYDYFGGYGFISIDNFEYCAQYNFSGRGKGQKKSGKEILDDFLQPHKKTNEQLEAIQTITKERYCFEQLMQNVMAIIQESKDYDEKAVAEFSDLFYRQSREVMNLYRDALWEFNSTKAALEEQTQYVSNLQQEAASLQAQLTSAFDSLEITEKNLEDTQKELVYTASCLDDVINSKAFKMTKPIRKLHSIMKQK